jgi:hypothetical protein
VTAFGFDLDYIGDSALRWNGEGSKVLLLPNFPKFWLPQATDKRGQKNIESRKFLAEKARTGVFC